ncbi:hypothetical protein ABTJ52_22820, partial [Acinetobacter baumannii]
ETAAPVVAPVDDIEFVDEAEADAHNEAMLDLIAAEMSAPQPIEDDFDMPDAEAEFAGPDVIPPDIIAPAPAMGERGPEAT